MSHEHLYCDDDLLRRIAARKASVGTRQRKLCQRCRKRIPEGKRADAKYCSVACKTRYNPEKRYRLIREVLVVRRTLKVVERCLCGQLLDTRVRPGPIPTQCTRCYMREAMRRWRAKRRDEVA